MDDKGFEEYQKMNKEIEDGEVTIMRGRVKDLMDKLAPDEAAELANALRSREVHNAFHWLEGWVKKFDDDLIDEGVLMIGVQVMTVYGQRLSTYGEKNGNLPHIQMAKIAKEVLEDLLLKINQNIADNEKRNSTNH